MAFRFLGLILLPWTLQVGGNKILRQLGDPIQVVLAPFEPFGLKLTCEFTYSYTQALKNYTFSYHYIDLKGKQSPSFLVRCDRAPGIENVTQTDKCPFTLKNLHNASATGTYYCQVKWQNSYRIKANGVFILVRDIGYVEPPKGHKKLLLLLFTSLLAVLSILGTGLLLWKVKSQRRSAKKIPNREDSNSEKSSADPKLEQSGSLYIALQPHLLEVYDSLQVDVSIPPAERSPPIQHQEGAEELNIIYENF
ncbi:NFAT activation molecule 1 isoform X2 [Sminthopsis crassicaudata]|uniref:NFAT activation molecule 1 isoform X2 n=1 Tax=Sminthopsis crassicaudata TaxID=9301 RepID=UPI003D69700F